MRNVTVAIPQDFDKANSNVVYCTDGQIVRSLCLALSEYQPPLSLPVLIGVHSDPIVRAQEYLPNDSEQFRLHEHFFVERLRSWACQTYGVCPERRRNAVFGFSNGGAFSVLTAIKYPDKFHASIAFSVPPAGPLPSVDKPGALMPEFYLSAGCLGPEKSIRKNVSKLSKLLKQKRFRVRYTEREAEHELDYWVSEFPLAIQWLNTL